MSIKNPLPAHDEDYQFFEGEITFKTEKRHKGGHLQKYMYKDCCNHELKNTFMRNFQFLNLSETEKQCLTREKRSLIYSIININCKQLQNDAKEMVKKIKKSKDFCISIQAEGYGSFVCLTAIYLGTLPTNKEINFNLTCCPLKLFPESLIQNNENIKHFQQRISLNWKEDCWTKEIKSLRDFPEHCGDFELIYDPDQAYFVA